MQHEVRDPFAGECPEQVYLTNAPLVAVISQIRFTEILSIQEASFIAGFQEKVREQYPYLHKRDVRSIDFDVGRQTFSQSDHKYWHFVDETKNWKITLASDFISLDTRKYVSREDFLCRLGKILNDLHDTIRPTHVTRIGVRYVDRVSLTGGLPLGSMLRPQLVGLAASEWDQQVERVTSEVVASVPEGTLLARWGKLPQSATHDPDNMPPIAQPSWFLDIDAFALHQNPEPFAVRDVVDTANALARRCYTFFRWAVKEEFLKAFGGSNAGNN